MDAMEEKVDSGMRGTITDTTKVLQGLSIILGGMQMILEGVADRPSKLHGPVLENETAAGNENQVLEEQEPEEQEFGEIEEDDVFPFEVETVHDGDPNQEEGANQEADPEQDTDLEQDTDPVQTDGQGKIEDASLNNGSPKTDDPPRRVDGTTTENPDKFLVTKDTLTKTIVSKIKQDRSYSDKINTLMNSYGVSQLSDLPEDKYESFYTELTRM